MEFVPGRSQLEVYRYSTNLIELQQALEINENTLGSFWTQISRHITCWADRSWKHKIEGKRLTQVIISFRSLETIFDNHFVHLCVCEPIQFDQDVFQFFLDLVRCLLILKVCRLSRLFVKFVTLISVSAEFLMRWSARKFSPVLTSFTIQSMKRSTCPDVLNLGNNATKHVSYFKTLAGVRAEHSTSSIESSRMKWRRQYWIMFDFKAHPIGPKS